MLSRKERAEFEDMVGSPISITNETSEGFTYKLEPSVISTVTEEMRSLYFKAHGTYASDTVIRNWYESLPEISPTTRGDGGSTFTKDDSAKPMLSLIDPNFITSLGDILTFGAQKYSKDNWKLCEDPSRYKDALLRHTYAYLSGELLDPESGFPHTAHIACNIMFLQWFDKQ